MSDHLIAEANRHAKALPVNPDRLALAIALQTIDELERENAALQVAGNEMCRILTIPGESDFKDWATEPEIDRAIAGWREAQP